MDRRRVIPIFLIVLVNFLGSTIVLPMLPLYAKRHFGASEEIIPLLTTAFFIAQFIAGPFLGRLSDKYGRLPILIISQFGTFLSFLMMAVAPSLAWLFVARVIDGITGGNVIVAQAYLTDISPRKQRTRALGITFMAFGLGYSVGPVLGGFFGIFGESVPFYVGALLTLATVILTWLTLDESLPAEKRMERREHRVRMTMHDITGNVPLVLILITGFGAQFSISQFMATSALFAEEVIFHAADPRYVSLMVGALLCAFGIGQSITQLALIQPLTARLTERQLVILGLFLRLLGMASLLVLTAPLAVGGFSIMLLAIGSGIMMPALQALTTISVREEISGGALGVYQSATSLGFILGSALSGILFAFAPTAPYLVGSIIFMLMFVPSMLLLRREQPILAETRAAA